MICKYPHLKTKSNNQNRSCHSHTRCHIRTHECIQSCIATCKKCAHVFKNATTGHTLINGSDALLAYPYSSVLCKLTCDIINQSIHFSEGRVPYLYEKHYRHVFRNNYIQASSTMITVTMIVFIVNS